MTNDLLLNEDSVVAVLDQVRPFMQRDGGDVALVKIEGTAVYIRLIGACAGCPISFITVTHGIQETLQKAITSVEKVIVVRE